MSSSQLGEEVTSLCAVNQNKHGRRAFCKAMLANSLYLMFLLMCWKALLGCLSEVGDDSSTHLPCHLFSHITTYFHETWIFSEIWRRFRVVLETCDKFALWLFLLRGQITFSEPLYRLRFLLGWLWLRSSHNTRPQHLHQEPGLFKKEPLSYKSFTINETVWQVL